MTRPPTALEAATAALARRDRPAAGLVAYLERRGVAGDEARAAVARLRDAGYVDDARYAERRAEVLAERGYGDEGIRFELLRDGVAAAEATVAVAALPPERERAAALLREAADPSATARRLLAKGFAPEALEAGRGRDGPAPPDP